MNYNSIKTELSDDLIKGMTNEDINGAINYLKSYRKLDENLHNMSPKDSVAYFATDKCLKYWDMAIEALEQEPKMGHWVKTPKAVMGEGYMWYCDKCEHQVYQDSSRPYPSEKYCPNCGAKMFEPQESDHKCHTCKHYTSGEHDGSCGSYICKGYSNWESEE